ncbi:MOLPALP family lipoprotein [Entomoplasma ellychniae]|uniref:MOLPALP family lipoprotein n=1 Tax=Entomoplasma ellychniae TaxID=2114 RepID=A0A8E2QWN4_9MOLU|nr:hypothetical protein [Entomoplasma ellychniae]PPE05051.1 MOLPALP family lipoprotein [Entomoplasma ellychniae]
MKKLLISLSIFGLSSASVSITAFTFTSKYRSEFQASIQKLITTTNISAEAQILSNPTTIENNTIKSVEVKGIEKSSTNANINYEYTINKMSSQKMVDFLPSSDWVKKLNSDKSWDQTITMEQQLNKNYNVAWKKEAKVLNLTGIKLTDGEKKGNSSTASTLSLISSLLGILFGSDFNVGQAQLLYQNSNLIFDLLGNYSLTPDVLTVIWSLFKDQLPTIETLKKYLNNPFESEEWNSETTVNDVMMHVGQNFWSTLIPKKASSDDKSSENKSPGKIIEIIEKFGPLLNYFLSIVWYLQQFDTDNVTSDDLAKVLNKKIDQDVIKSFDEINISKILTLVRKFLKPSYGFKGARGLVNILFGIPKSAETNNLGSNIIMNSNIIMSPLFKMLKERNAKSEDTKDDLNENTQAIENEDTDSSKKSFDWKKLIQDIFKLVTNLDSSDSSTSNIDWTKLIKDVLETVKTTISSLPKNVDWAKLILDVLEWVKTPNSLPANIFNSLKQSITMIIQLIKKKKYNNIYDLIEFILNETLFKSLTEEGKKPIIIGDILYLLAMFKNSKLPNDNKINLDGLSSISSISGVPNDLFVAIYNGELFKSLFQLINVFKPNTISNLIIEIAPDLKTLLSLKMNEVFELLGLDFNKNFQFLYGLRNMSLLNIVEQLDKYFKPNDGSSLESYYFDYGSFRHILLSLFENQEVEYKGTKETVSNIEVMIKSLIAALENNEITIGNIVVKEPKKALLVALGLTLDGNQFIKNSIFETISKAYGHNLEGNQSEDPSKAENTVKLITGLVDLSSWFINVSEAEYTNDNFGDFFNQKNWYTKFINQTNYENIYSDSYINYQLDYKISKYKINESYTVTLFREKSKSNALYGDKNYKVFNITRN